MPDEGDKNESEIEAEMLRMMEQEAAGGASADAVPTSESAPPGGSPEDEMMQMMQQALAESQGEAAASASESNDDRTLEMEMLKAMQGDEASGLAAPFQAFVAPAEVESASAGLPRLLDVDVEITVELGENHIPIKDILLWGEGTLVELERMDREPVDVLVNGKLFARGEVVVVGETFGVKITELLNGATRR